MNRANSALVVSFTIGATFLCAACRSSESAPAAGPRDQAARETPRDYLAVAPPPIVHDSPKPPLDDHGSAAVAELIDLPREALQNVDTEYVAYRETLGRSGRSSEPWTAEARQLFEKFFAAPDGYRASAVECYTSGCIVDVTYPPTEDGQVVADQLIEAFFSLKWSGNAIATGVRDGGGGGRTNAFVLVRPL